MIIIIIMVSPYALTMIIMITMITMIIMMIMVSLNALTNTTLLLSVNPCIN